jgi:predicted nucleic acid-binding protein
MQPAVVRTALSFADAFRALKESTSSPEHRFWPMSDSFLEIPEQMQSRLAGHHQLADAMLIGLALRNSGKLATFDHRAGNLIDPAPDGASAIELIPV